jgi:acyl transferase domain-containing protein
MTSETAATVLAPKVTGTIALAEALHDRPQLDFFVCFSSRAAVDGLIGAADYAAGNSFQDAYTMALRRAGVPALSVNWPSWAKVGMAAELGMRTWTAELGPDNCVFLAEHRINGVPVLPGTGHIDLALRAHRELTGEVSPVRLKDVVFHQVMVASEVRQVEVRLFPGGRFESRSRPLRDPGAEPITHASGIITRSAPAPTVADLAALRARLSSPLADDDAGAARLFTLGPHWDNIAGMWTAPGGDEGELLIELQLPPEFTAEAVAHVLHPTILDVATGSVRRPAEDPYLPLLYESMLVLDQLPGHVFSHIRRRPTGSGVIVADIDLIAPDGKILAEISGYTMRKVSDLRFLAVDPPSGDTSAPGTDGIEPREGARLLLTLLGARHPGQVAVRSNARPVPVRAGLTASNGSATTAQPRDRRSQQPVSEKPALGSPAAVSEPVHATAGTSVEDRLAGLWAEAIGDTSLPYDADFFEDLGGTSLTAVTLMTSIKEIFQLDLSIATLFDYPTVTAFAQMLRELGAR